MTSQPLKVCVLAGGDSAEREVSLASAGAVRDGLTRLGHHVTTLDSSTVPLAELAQNTQIVGSDVVFIVLHGGDGENGEVQQTLEIANKRFTGSSSSASALAMSKPHTKALAQKLQILTPEWIEFPVTDSPATLNPRIVDSIRLPVILKPADGGSTVGLTLVREVTQIPAALTLLAEHCAIGMAERYIAGRELTVAVLAGEALEVVEIKPKNGLYDYHAKYTRGGSEYFCPADIDSRTRDTIRTTARDIFGHIKCSGLARVDYILDEHGMPQFLEINTIPGMTDLSLAPMSAAGAGISFTELLQRALQSALR